MINVFEIIDYFYPEPSSLKDLLLKHSTQVKEKALEILGKKENSDKVCDVEIVIAGALLHDIGICQCHAPSILCEGLHPYICHGTIGAEMLREYGIRFNMDLEPFARICERHTGAGLTAENIREQGLPLAEKDYIPETNEEKLICLADKFFSKSGDMQEKSFERVRQSMMKFGTDTVARFDEMCELFNVSHS